MKPLLLRGFFIPTSVTHSITCCVAINSSLNNSILILTSYHLHHLHHHFHHQILQSHRHHRRTNLLLHFRHPTSLHRFPTRMAHQIHENHDGMRNLHLFHHFFLLHRVLSK